MTSMLLVFAAALSVTAQGTPAGAPAPEPKPPAAQGTTQSPSEPSGSPASSETPPTVGQGTPPVVLPPTATAANVTVRVTLDEGATAAEQDVRAGLLVSAANPDLQIVPLTKVGKMSTSERIATLDLSVSGLVPFGDFTVPLLYRGRHADTLRFQKPGLLAVRPDTGDIVAQQKLQYLQLVLANPSVYDYTHIRARVRFHGIEECQFGADQKGETVPLPGQTWRNWIRNWFRRATNPGDCVGNDAWSRFDVRASSQVTLHIPLHDGWFEDLESGLTRSATRKGLLTLRYFPLQTNATTLPLAEQNIPVDVRFEARSQRLFFSILWVFVLLLTGALIFLLLRVSIPNYRRKKDLKDKLNNLRNATERVSDQVDSQLRVLIRVDRLALDQLRRNGWVLVPGFDEIATRIEAGIATLTRKIGLVERLDGATCRRENLVLGAVAPTRLDIIDRNLDSACEVLKNDQLGDADWLFVQQRLEAADKALNEPSPEEKQAFEALLSSRWQSILEHFKTGEGGQTLAIPDALAAFKDCFPDGSLLPETKDTDGMQWIASVGAVHADLQLTALELLREAHFLARALNHDKWKGAAVRIAGWLSTPAIATLGSARGLLRQVADDVPLEVLVKALEGKKAHIDMDPQTVSPNQTVRLTVRFRDPVLNDVAAQSSVRCEWQFQDPSVEPEGKASPPASVAGRVKDWIAGLRGAGQVGAPAQAQEQVGDRALQLPFHVERGWRVHRYFEPKVTQQRMNVRFFVEGEPVVIDDKDGHYSRVVVPQLQEHNVTDSREKWVRFGFQTVQMFAVLLVPLVTLAMSTADEPATGRWWDLIGLGFGSEAIRNILTGEHKP